MKNELNTPFLNWNLKNICLLFKTKTEVYFLYKTFPEPFWGKNNHSFVFPTILISTSLYHFIAFIYSHVYFPILDCKFSQNRAGYILCVSAFLMSTPEPGMWEVLNICWMTALKNVQNCLCHLFQLNQYFKSKKFKVGRGFKDHGNQNCL